MTRIKMNYFYGEQANQYSFIRIPKELVVGEEFSSLSVYAKVLYGILLDRIGMSEKNKWLDEESRVYIVYSIEDIQADMGISKRKAIECLTELEKLGLVEKRKRGKGLPTQLYIKNFNKKESIAYA